MAPKQTTQVYQFVTYTGEDPDKDKKQVLSNIRKHVMHDYFRKQGKTVDLPVGKSKKGKSKADTLPSGSSTQPVRDDTSLIITAPPTRTRTPPKSDHMPGSPRGPRFDPFDSLPVKGIPDDLIEWFPCLYEGDSKNTSWVHKSNVMWAQNIWHSSTQDTALFYTVLSQAERNRLVVTKSEDKRRYLFLRGQALQALRKRMGTATTDDPNTLILLIAYQIRFAIVEGDFVTAKTHLQAASLLIAREGAKVGPFVLVHATLMDVKLAAASWTRPELEFQDPHLRLQTSRRLAEIVHERAQISLQYFPSDFRGAAAEEAMRGLHWHFLKFDAEYGKEVDGSFGVLLNCVRTARHLRSLAANAWEECEAEEEEMTRPRIALALCLEFFAWMHDPAHIIPWISHSQFMKRLGDNVRGKLKHCLHIEDEDIENVWEKTGAHRESLLWVLMIGFVMTANTEAEVDGSTDLSSPYLRTMSRVLSSLQIRDQKQLEHALKMFPWTDNFCGTWSTSILARLGLPAIIEEAE
ncbi:hypothetical protein AAFC00_006498 [Neodothiora populina]|uniref:Uncharacterized protein n=1 Tax=Neodothiora populina TaxID=2781224 RepID=A0ABR3P5D5_9PEZI